MSKNINSREIIITFGDSFLTFFITNCEIPLHCFLFSMTLVQLFFVFIDIRKEVKIPQKNTKSREESVSENLFCSGGHVTL